MGMGMLECQKNYCQNFRNNGDKPDLVKNELKKNQTNKEKKEKKLFEILKMLPTY